MRKILLSALLLSLALVGCKGKLKAPDGYDIVTAQSKPIVNEIFFSGTIQPLKSVAVTSPVEGVIEKKNFEYGQQVKEGAVLFTIRSSQLEKDYREALTSYLKAKEQYNTNKSKLHEDEILHKEGVISTNEFHNSETAYNDTYISFLQTERNLKETLEKAHTKVEETKALMMSDREAVGKALLAKFDVLDLTAPTEGVALMPEKGAGTGDGADASSTKFIVGSQVKTGQVLASIGDKNGISVTVSVNQVDVNSIKPGQRATVTSDGFPGIVLRGVVADVSAQAVATPGSGLPTFPVRVEVQNINDEDHKKIAVGMSAMVRISVDHPPMIMVPIKAVTTKNGMSTIKMFDRVTHKIVNMPVATGQTTLQEVAITRGLQPGDHILVHR